MSLRSGGVATRKCECYSVSGVVYAHATKRGKVNYDQN